MANENVLGSNGLGFQLVSDHRTFKDADGALIQYEGEYVDLPCTAAVARGALVRLTAPSAAGVPMRVTQKTSATANTEGYLVYGVAMNATTAAGQMVRVCRKGICEVNVGSATPAVGNWASLSTGTSGEAAVQTSAPAATAVLGEFLGIFMSTKDASNRAILFFEHY